MGDAAQAETEVETELTGFYKIMEVNEIWEFNNGVAYDLCRIVSVNPPSAIHAQTNSPVKSAYLIDPAAPGWNLVGKATHPLGFKVIMPKKNSA